MREELREGSGLFSILAFMPAQASFGLADDLRRRTSGGASAALMLSHWERLQVRRHVPEMSDWLRLPTVCMLAAPLHTQRCLGGVCRSCRLFALHMEAPSRRRRWCSRHQWVGNYKRSAHICSCCGCESRVQPLKWACDVSSCLQVDPFFVPVTEEEREEFGEEGQGVGTANLARTLLDEVRRRKGLAMDKKVVESATKQRTRARKV